jgi:hypothetical protein
MPVITFTVRRGLSASQKSRLSEAMLEAQVPAGFERNDLFHRFLEVDPSDLLVDPRCPGYETDRTDRFVLLEVIIPQVGRQERPRVWLTKRSGCSASACTWRLRTSYSSSKKWIRTCRAFPGSRTAR